MNQYPTMPPTRTPMLTNAPQTPGITPAVRALMQRQAPPTTGPVQPPSQMDGMAQGIGMAPGAAPVQLGQAMRQLNNQIPPMQSKPMQIKPMQGYGNSENLPIDFSNYNPAPFTKQPFNQGNWRGQISTQDPSTRKLPQVPQYLAERMRAFGTI